MWLAVRTVRDVPLTTLCHLPGFGHLLQVVTGFRVMAGNCSKLKKEGTLTL